jgi:hypothetical protein
MPRCPEDSNSREMHMPYVDENRERALEFSPRGCTWFDLLLGTAGDYLFGGKGHNEELIPAKPGVAPETPEESEPAVPRNPPKCQEEPGCQYQYPGCPFLEDFPCGATCPDSIKAPKAAPAKKPKKKVEAIPMSFSRALRSLLDGGVEVKDDDVPSRLDTMECRPSDLRLPGLDPHEPF